MPVLLMRHAEPDWAVVQGRGWVGAAHDLAPLTARGRSQAVSAAVELAGKGIARVVSSPMTRALQTASLVAHKLGLPLGVDIDLREWLPDDTFRWRTGEEVATAYADLVAHGGEHPLHGSRTWEAISAVEARARAVLDPLAAQEGLVLAVCHEVVIAALTGESRTSHGGLRHLPRREGHV